MASPFALATVKAYLSTLRQKLSLRRAAAVGAQPDRSEPTAEEIAAGYAKMLDAAFEAVRDAERQSAAPGTQ